ncbi:MAG: hypothetical protein ABEJ22_06390 [Haloferacaceae archaeon]
MRLADDRRGRVPFALVGVVLLVGSVTFSATLATRGPSVSDRSVDDAMERVEASTVSVLRAAADDAARDAGRNPVTTPSNTSAGRVLNESGTFRDYLRLRIYLAARRHLRRSEHRVGSVTASASLPATETPAALRAAKRRVAVEAVDGGASLRVSVANVTLSARRDGRVVARERTPVVVTVANPVLALHDRTETYQRRLNRGPLDGDGLGRRLTARLYPVVWVRGYAQYGGLPIENVLGNRHVALSSNGAALRLQRATFGRADPDGWRGLRRATGRTALSDLLEPTPVDAGLAVDAVTSHGDAATETGGSVESSGSNASERVDSARRFEVSVDRAADGAYLGLLDGDGNRSLGDVLGSTYSVEARLATRVRRVHSERRPPRTPPGDNWTLGSERVTRTVTVEPADGGGANVTAQAGSGAVVAERFSRRVVVDATVERRWYRGREPRRTSAEWTTAYRVDVAVVVDSPRGGAAPPRTTRPLFERGGALGGPNLVAAPERAVSRLVDEPGGPDEVARRVALGKGTARSARVRGDRPAGLRNWVVADLASLGERVRNVSVNVSTGDVAGGRANPRAALAERLRARRTALVDAPDTYDGVADRARVAARATYLDGVIRRLSRQGERTSATNGRFDRLLREAGAGSAARVGRIHDAVHERGGTGAAATGGSRDGPVEMVPDAEPAYLSLAGVAGDESPAVARGRTFRPLTARNVNLFAVPYGDATDAVLAGAFDRPDSVPLRTASRALVAANPTLDAAGNATLRRRRNALRREVRASLRVVENRVDPVLRRRTELSYADRLTVVRAASARWSADGRRGLAVANGSFARAVVEEAARRAALSDTEVDTLSVAVRHGVRRSLDERPTWVAQPTANRTETTARRIARRAVTGAVDEYGPEAVQAAKDRWAGDVLGDVPAGLPLLPAPGYRYATVNVWTVTVRGSYARFAVRTPRATPATPGVGTTYVRDGDSVALDVDGDGEAERLGRGERLSFSVRTVVVVVVPPSGNGVGDVGGDVDERSGGWPRPGYEASGGRAGRLGGGANASAEVHTVGANASAEVHTVGANASAESHAVGANASAGGRSIGANGGAEAHAVDATASAAATAP